ncbi:MAG: bacterial Ig-like domain-containing protein [Clostridia bacterium]|nr:bacterial Ig-like domain-containing protein [Clostridia bacterium]
MKKSIFKKLGGLFLGLAMGLGVAICAKTENKASKVEASAGDQVNFTYTTSSSKKFSTTYGENSLVDDNIAGLAIKCTTAKLKGNGVIQNTYSNDYGSQQMTTNTNRDTTVSCTFENPWSNNNQTYKSYTQINYVSLTAVAGSSTSYNVSCTIDGVAATGNHTSFNATKTICKFTPAEGHEKGVIVFTVTYSSGSKGWYFDNLSINAQVPGTSKTLSSIAVKTSPTKVNYLSGEKFDASGLVITATYSDSSTEDIAYNENVDDFTFDKETITSSGNVTITYGGKTCTQPVTLISVVDVIEVKSAPTSIGINQALPVSDVVLNVSLSNGTFMDVNPTSITLDTTSTGEKTAIATYNLASGEKNATFTITVVSRTTYDLSKIDGFSSWTNSYSNHTVKSTSITGATTAATLDFALTNKQSSGVGSSYPCIGGKNNNEVTCLTFTLTEEGKKISSVSITFVTRYTATFPTLYLHKGSGIESEALSSLKMSGTSGDEHELTYSAINDTIFTVGYNANQTSSNGRS